MRPVIVLWDDAYSEDEWMSIEQYNPKPETPNISVGYLVSLQQRLRSYCFHS
jgi:hypothetical protein